MIEGTVINSGALKIRVHCVVEDIDDDDRDALRIVIEVTNEGVNETRIVNTKMRTMDGGGVEPYESAGVISPGMREDFSYFVPNDSGAWLFKIEHDAGDGVKKSELGPHSSDMRIAETFRKPIADSGKGNAVGGSIFESAFDAAMTGFGEEIEIVSPTPPPTNTLDPLASAFTSEISTNNVVPSPSQNNLLEPARAPISTPEPQISQPQVATNNTPKSPQSQQMPPGGMPPGGMPPGGMPPRGMPPGMMPPGMMPPGMMPPGGMPPRGMPPGMMPPGGMPPGMMPPGGMPPGMMPPGGMPPGMMPPRGMPQQMPPQGMPQQMPPQGMPQQMPPQGMPQQMPPQGMPQQMPPQGMPQQMPPQGITQSTNQPPEVLSENNQANDGLINSENTVEQEANNELPSDAPSEPLPSTPSEPPTGPPSGPPPTGPPTGPPPSGPPTGPPTGPPPSLSEDDN